MPTLIRDGNIQKLVKSWNPVVKILLIVMALFTTAPIISFEWYFSALNHLFLYNVRFGGFVLLCFFLIWKKGKIADIILASPVGYKTIEIDNVYLRCIVYLATIIIWGFIFPGVSYVLGFSQTILPFQMDFWNFMVMIFFVPISEEIYYRFLIIYITGSILGRATGIVISLSLFTLSHDYSQFYITGMIWVASFALISTITTISFGSLWPAIALHSLNNAIVYFSSPF